MGIQDQIAADLGAVFATGLADDAVHDNGVINETLRVFFDQPHALALDDRAASSLPQITLQATDAGNITKKDSRFTVGGVQYSIIEIHPTDASGLVKIELSEVSA